MSHFKRTFFKRALFFLNRGWQGESLVEDFEVQTIFIILIVQNKATFLIFYFLTLDLFKIMYEVKRKVKKRPL